MMDAFRFIVLVLLVLQAGCAPQNWSSEDDGTYDPLEPINRRIYIFNSDVKTLFKPMIKLYPSSGGEGTGGKGLGLLNNFYENLKEPKYAINHALQQNGTDTVNSLSRFVYNSTFGIGGLFDVASKFGVERQSADFGQTFRAYGFNNTTYLVLPFIGPSSVTDTTGGVFDSYTSPLCCWEGSIDNKTVVRVIGGVANRAKLSKLGDIVGEIALDEYSFVRDAYEEARASEAKKRAQSFTFKTPSIKIDEHIDSNGVWTVTYDATIPQTADDGSLSTQQ